MQSISIEPFVTFTVIDYAVSVVFYTPFSRVKMSATASPSKSDVDDFEEKRKLKDELKFIQDMRNFQKGVVKLNVGGRLFMTSVFTLSRDQNSMLAALVSGRHPLPQQPDGSYFIDRDGTHFRYILNYLRGDRGMDSLPDTWTDQHQLLKEAKYYRIEGLIKVLSLKMGK